jgi:hypothetical protein
MLSRTPLWILEASAVFLSFGERSLALTAVVEGACLLIAIAGRRSLFPVDGPAALAQPYRARLGRV